MRSFSDRSENCSVISFPLLTFYPATWRKIEYQKHSLPRRRRGGNVGNWYSGVLIALVSLPRSSHLVDLTLDAQRADLIEMGVVDMGVYPE